MAHDVFVSHSVKDKAVAEKVVAHLERESIRCWVAPRDVVPGADWGESIIDALESSRVMVLVFSRNANGSSQIKREVERAVDKDIYTIPFRVDDIEPTRSLEYFISTSQWMDAFTPPLEPHLEKLSRTVKAVLAKSEDDAPVGNTPPLPAREVPPPPTALPEPRRANWMMPAAIAAGALILLAGILAFSLSHKETRPQEKTPEMAVEKTATPADRSSALTSPVELNITPETPNQPGIKNPPANIGYREAAPNRMKTMIAPLATPEPTGTEPPWMTKGGGEAPPVISKYPPSPNKAAVEDPAALVRRYYGSINQRDVMQAYDCLSQGFKARRTYDQFVQIFATTESIDLRQLEEISRSEDAAAVNVAFVETEAGKRRMEWEGRVSVVKEGDAWRINGASLKRKPSPPAKAY